MANYFLHFNASSEPSYPFWETGFVGKRLLNHEDFLLEIGFRVIDAFIYYWNDEPKDPLNARLDAILGGLQRHDCLVIQWPFPGMSERWIENFIDRVHAFNTNAIFLVNDIQSMNNFPELPGASDQEKIDTLLKDPDVISEVKFLSRADGLIVSSPQMADHITKELALAGKKVTSNITWLGPDGYEANYFQSTRHFDQGIDFVGTLAEASFLLKLPHELKINVHGASPDDQKLVEDRDIHLHPRVDVEAAPQLLQGSYGLIWHSDQYPEAHGTATKIDKYALPIELPLFLSANEPVIVWSQAAAANFVQANGVGILIDSLNQLPQKLAAIDEQAYEKMIVNAQRISPLIRDGFFVKQATLNVIGQIYNKAESASDD